MTLNEYLQTNNISYSEMARRLKKDQCWVSRISKGTKKPSWKLAVQIESLTNKSVPRTNWYPNE